MFNKLKKNAQKQIEKDEKAKAQAIEDAKSEAQKAYEKMREDGKEAALAFAKEAQGKLASMGWRWFPIIQHINPTLPNAVHAVMVLTELPWEAWEKRTAKAEQAAAEAKAGTEAAPSDATQASPNDAGEAKDVNTPSDTSEGV